MLVYKTQYPEKTPCVLALGCFDTVHLGHMQLMNVALECAKENNLYMGVYMFADRPAHILDLSAKPDVYSATAREHIFEKIGVNYIYYERFTKAFMQMSPETFVEYLIDKFDVRIMVVGFNYRFGIHASGDSDLLCKICKKHGIQVKVVPAVCDSEGVISSTRIRMCLENGDILTANKLLGRMYTMDGVIRQDRGVGRTMGFPTANLTVDKNLLIPKNGVYSAVTCVDGKLYPVVVNVGVRPTFGLEQRCIEAHLLDFKGDLYGQSIVLHFVLYLREEIKFSDIQLLQKQIFTDIQAVKELFSKINLETLQI